MKEAFISILTLSALAVNLVRCSDVNRDGFNFYKDYLRGRSDESIPEDLVSPDRTLYFYRTPVQMYTGVLPFLEQEYRKRTGNAYKNHMLSKESSFGDVESIGKRSSKAALALMLQGKQNQEPFENAFGDKTSVRVV